MASGGFHLLDHNGKVTMKKLLIAISMFPMCATFAQTNWTFQWHGQENNEEKISMKTKPVIFVITAMLGTSHCIGQSNIVYYGTNSNALNVVFVDTNLSKKVQSAIVTDLRICLLEWGKKNELRLRNKGDSAGYLHNSDTCPHYPESIDFPKNIVSNGTAGVALQISKELSDAYTNAFKFAAANSNVVAAAYAFVSLVTSNGFVDTLTPANVSHYFLGEKYKPEDYVTHAQDIKEFFERTQFFPPSILGFRQSGMFPTPQKELQLVIPGYFRSDNNPKLSLSGFPALWHDGKWKFYIGDWY